MSFFWTTSSPQLCLWARGCSSRFLSPVSLRSCALDDERAQPAVAGDRVPQRLPKTLVPEFSLEFSSVQILLHLGPRPRIPRTNVRERERGRESARERKCNEKRKCSSNSSSSCPAAAAAAALLEFFARSFSLSFVLSFSFSFSLESFESPSLNFSRCARVSEAYELLHVQEAPKKKGKTGSSSSSSSRGRKERERKKVSLSPPRPLLSLARHSPFFFLAAPLVLGFRITAMARRLRRLLPLLFLVAAGVAAAAPAAADADAAAASPGVRLVPCSIGGGDVFFQFERRDRCTTGVALSASAACSFASSCACSSTGSIGLAPGAANSKHRARGAPISEKSARCFFRCRSPRAITDFFASHDDAARALVLSQDRALSKIRPERARKNVLKTRYARRDEVFDGEKGDFLALAMSTSSSSSSSDLHPLHSTLNLLFSTNPRERTE